MMATVTCAIYVQIPQAVTKLMPMDAQVRSVVLKIAGPASCTLVAFPNKPNCFK